MKSMPKYVEITSRYQDLVLTRTNLLVFMDNVLDLDSVSEGTTILRRYSASKSRPMTAGVPIAWSSWGSPPDYFEDIDDKTERAHIRKALKRIRSLIEEHKYETLTFLADAYTATESPGHCPLQIQTYIIKALRKLCEGETKESPP